MSAVNAATVALVEPVSPLPKTSLPKLPTMRASAPRRLPRRQPLHDLGLQVRPARGSGEAE